MKSNLKLGAFNISSEKFLCDFIFKFQLIDKQQNEALIEALFLSINKSDAFTKKAFRHTYNADCYFTNGEIIISLRKENGVFELGIHPDLKKFEHYFFSNFHTRKIWDVHISFKKYRFKESLEKEIYNILSVSQGKRKLLVMNWRQPFVEAYTEHNTGVFLKLEPKRIEGYNTQDLIEVSKKFEEKFKPIQLKSCFNCGDFNIVKNQSIVEANSLHECMFIKEKTAKLNSNEAVTHVWSFCSEYHENC